MSISNPYVSYGKEQNLTEAQKEQARKNIGTVEKEDIEAAVKELEEKITAEENRATAAENNISNNLTNEINRATGAEATLNTNIINVQNSLNSEIQRAENREDSIESSLNSEIERAKDAENDISDKLTQEIEDREEADKLKQDKVTISAVNPSLSASDKGFFSANIDPLFVVYKPLQMETEGGDTTSNAQNNAATNEIEEWSDTLPLTTGSTSLDIKEIPFPSEGELVDGKMTFNIRCKFGQGPNNFSFSFLNSSKQKAVTDISFSNIGDWNEGYITTEQNVVANDIKYIKINWLHPEWGRNEYVQSIEVNSVTGLVEKSGPVPPGPTPGESIDVLYVPSGIITDSNLTGCGLFPENVSAALGLSSAISAKEISNLSALSGDNTSNSYISGFNTVKATNVSANSGVFDNSVELSAGNCITITDDTNAKATIISVSSEFIEKVDAIETGLNEEIRRATAEEEEIKRMISEGALSAGSGINISSNLISVSTASSSNISFGFNGSSALTADLNDTISVSNISATNISAEVLTVADITAYPASALEIYATRIIGTSGTTTVPSQISGFESLYIGETEPKFVVSGEGTTYITSGNKLIDLSAALTGAGADLSELSAAISAEIERATSAEKELSDTISNVSSELMVQLADVSGELSSAIDAETERAIEVETELSGSISALESSATYLESLINDEIDRAMSAEDDLSDAISALDEKLDDAVSALSAAIDTKQDKLIAIDTDNISMLVDDNYVSAELNDDISINSISTSEISASGDVYLVSANDTDPALFTDIVSALKDSVVNIDSYLEHASAWDCSGIGLEEEGGFALGSACFVSDMSVAEGYGSIAIGFASHAEGGITKASGDYAHAEGSKTNARAYASHAEGELAIVNSAADYSHAEGKTTYCIGRAAHAEGGYTIVNNDYEHAEGRFNCSHSAAPGFGSSANTLHSIGIGSGIFPAGIDDPLTHDEVPYAAVTAHSKNAVEVMQNGDLYVLGVGGYDGSAYSAASTVQDVISTKLDIVEFESYSAEIDETISAIVDDLSEKQDKLNAGDGIKIDENNVISVSSDDLSIEAGNGINIHETDEKIVVAMDPLMYNTYTATSGILEILSNPPTGDGKHFFGCDKAGNIQWVKVIE